jgi:hypothetical protein
MSERRPTAVAHPTSDLDMAIVSRILGDIRQDALRLSLEARACFESDWPAPDLSDTPTEGLVKSREMLFVAARLSQVVLWVVKEESESFRGDHATSAPWLIDDLLMSDSSEDDVAFADNPRVQALRNESLSLYCRVARLQAQSDGASN